MPVYRPPYPASKARYLRMVQFIDLWRGHPVNESVAFPCRASVDAADIGGRPVQAGEPAYANQSAISVGVALRRGGLRVEDLGKVTTCAVHDKSEMHILNARQLADALRRAKPAGFGAVEIITGGDVERFHIRLLGRTGVIYIRDYYVRSSDAQGRLTGDLIDLWNGYRTTENWLMEWLSWVGYRPPYAQAREIWFWPVS
ncbi:MAG: T6SS effector amidase Tae4 family protein [Hyphomicrobium sp.]